MEALTDLAIESIKDHATTKVRLASLETALINMANNDQKILDKINEIQTSLALIVKEQAHTDKEIKKVRVDLDDLIADHSPCKSLADGITKNANAHKLLAGRVDEVEQNCERCPISGYKELSEKVDVMSKDLKELCKALKVVTYNLKMPILNIPIPVWVLVLLLVIFNTVFVVANNWEWLMTAWSVVK